MKRGWPVVLVLVLALALAGVVGQAQGQSGSGLLFFGAPAVKLVSQTTIPAQARGELVVSFHGDAGAGCAAYGLCSYTGTIVFRPRASTISVVTLHHRGRIEHAVELLLGSGDGAYTTSTRVQRSAPGGPSGTCADAQTTFFGANAAAVTRGGLITIRLLAPGGLLLQTRCAGPVDGDLAVTSPSVTVGVARLLRGRMVLDLSGTRTFAVHGFAGTITSTLVMKLDKPQPQTSFSGSPSFPPGIKTQRMRIVTERLSLVRVEGRLSAAVRGTDDPVVCGLLDTCGLNGTLTLGTVGHDASADVMATGPANRPYRDFLTALGLARSGRARGIAVSVLVGLTGQARAAISQGGGTCDDVAATGGVSAAFSPLSGGSTPFGGFANTWRTRCPGPLLENASTGVVASLRKGALGRRVFTLELRAKGSFTDDGYVISPQGRLSVVLRRGPITQQVITEPAP